MMQRWPAPVGPVGLMKALPPFDVMTRTDEESSSSLDLMHLPPIVCVRVYVRECVSATVLSSSGDIYFWKVIW